MRQSAPQEYQLFVWRKLMRVSYNEAMATPYEVVLQDLEMSGLEDRFQPRPPEQDQKTQYQPKPFSG